jgi:ABC-2 type transport system permease protein
MNVQFRMRVMRWFSFGLVVTQPAIFSAVGYFLAMAAGRTKIDLIHTIIGSGVMGLWSTLLFTSYFDLRADRREGTLEILVGSPTSILTILAVRSFTNVLLGGISFLLSVLVAFLFFDFSTPSGSMPYIFISLLVLFFGVWCLGVFLAHLPVLSRLGGVSLNYFELPVGIVCGFMFPVSLLPAWARWLAFLTPMSSAFNGLAASLQPGFNPSSILGSWLLSLATCGVYLVFIRLMSGRVNDMIRVTGELSSV